MALKNNTWKVNQWYDQAVAGNVSYSGEIQMWMWGRNEHGEFGINDRTSRSSPTQIPGATFATNTFFASNSTGGTLVMVKTDGTLWSWGRDDAANLGHNERNVKRSSPTQIGSGNDWSKSGTLDEQGWGIKTNGSLWIWGQNNYGTLGQNDLTQRSSPVQIPGTTWERCYDAEYGSILATKTDNTLWGWGRNGGRLGLNQGPAQNTGYSSPVQIGDADWSVVGAAGPGTAGGIKTDGTLWMWGNNATGQLGQNAAGDNAQRSSPTQVGSDTTWSKLSVLSKGWGAIKTDGTLWVIGTNYGGALGLNQSGIDGYSSPVQLGSENTWDTMSFSYRTHLATKTDGTLWSWGYNHYGNLGHNNKHPVNYSSPTQIPGTEWYEIHTIANGNTCVAFKNV